MGRLLLPALVVLLAACNPAAAIVHAQDRLGGALESTQSSIAPAVATPTLALQAVAQEALPKPAPAAVPPSEAVALIVRWEVTSPQVYTRRYVGIACPGGASGPTIGIGADLGQQTPAAIAHDWGAHPDVARLQSASGQVGDSACRAWRARNADIRVPYALAVQVFERATLPRYIVAASRALRHGWVALPVHAQDANVSLGYNRGWAMSGDRNREKRTIRDSCVPAGDTPCNADALRSMCRLWPASTPNGKGLCARRNAEADLAVRA